MVLAQVLHPRSCSHPRVTTNTELEYQEAFNLFTLFNHFGITIIIFNCVHIVQSLYREMAIIIITAPNAINQRSCEKKAKVILSAPFTRRRAWPHMEVGDDRIGRTMAEAKLSEVS